MPPAILLTSLGAYNLLPAIVFLPTRRRCDQAASEAAFMRRDPNNERRDARRDFMRSFSEQYPEVRAHRHWDTILRGAVASHHAGHLPAWKLAIEKLMSAGLLDAIFATATVAAGVDFPARTVVITGVDARTGSGWRQLSASELQQMTGRAGRRGRDNIGFIVAAPGLHQDPERIVSLLRAQPDPLVSQFRATYTTLLNLLDAFGSFAHVREIAEKSFAHRETASRIAALDSEIARSQARIKEKLAADGNVVSLQLALGFERLASARTRLQELKPQTRAELLRQWLEETVRPGRIVGIGRSGRRLVMITERREGNAFGIREDGRAASLPLERIGRVYAPVYRLGEPSIEAAFEEIRQRGRELVMPEPRLRSYTEEGDAINLVDDLIDSLAPAELSGPERSRLTELLWATLDDAAAIQGATRRIDQLQTEVWLPFELRARVLAALGYLEFEAERVTERGRWLADLHLDRPLVVGEALEKGLFGRLDVARMAGVVAALTADEDRDYGELELDDALVESLSNFEEIGFQVANEEWKHGLEPAPELNFSAAATAAHWVRGKDWSTLVHETRAEEGDLFRVLSRTGEALLQVAGLRKSHPRAARIAAAAAEVVLREPVR